MKRFFKSLLRAFQYAKQGYKSHDWDSFYIIQDITFKLKRMEKYLFNEGIAEHSRITKQSLRRTIELGEILTSNICKDRNFIKDCDKIVDITNSEDGNYKIYKVHPTYKLAMDLQHQQDDYNYQMFFTLLKKYSQYWWD